MLTYFCELHWFLWLSSFPFFFALLTAKAAFPTSLLRRIKFFLTIQAYHVDSLQGMKKEHRSDTLRKVVYLIVLTLKLITSFNLENHRFLHDHHDPCTHTAPGSLSFLSDHCKMKGRDNQVARRHQYQNIWHFVNLHTTRSSTRKSPVAGPSSFVQQVSVGSFPVVGGLLVVQEPEGCVEATFQFLSDLTLCRFPILLVIPLCLEGVSLDQFLRGPKSVIANSFHSCSACHVLVLLFQNAFAIQRPFLRLLLKRYVIPSTSR